MRTRTKIICTIGPSVDTLEKMLALIDAGMDVARLNFSHGTHAEHGQVIALLKEARKLKGRPLAIMLDTRGPEIRVGQLPREGLQLVPGDRWKLTAPNGDLAPKSIPVVPAEILVQFSIGQPVLFDDGYINSVVVENDGSGDVWIEIKSPGLLKSRKGINVPGMDLSQLPDMTPQDIEDIRFGCSNDVDMVAASFVRNVDQVLAIKSLLAEENRADTLVIAKIENGQGIENIDAILHVADGIMVARGDLGVEMPLSQVPKLQKMLIHKSYLAGKPVVTATQMLESMIHQPRPTRAEVSDVANAIYDSTSAVMLSGETAVGAYPIETVQMMRRIIAETEADIDYHAHFTHNLRRTYHDVPSSIAVACVRTAYTLNAAAIFAFTHTGHTARLISRLRPVMPILALAEREKVYHQLAFNWGVIPVFLGAVHSQEESQNKLTQFALDAQYVQYGDLTVSATGSQFGVPRTTNTIYVESIGDVLVRGGRGHGKRVQGQVAIVHSPSSRPSYEVRERIIVLTHCNEEYAPFIEHALGVILENHEEERESEEWALRLAKRYNIPVLVRAETACRTLKEGQLITLDPAHVLVYKGFVQS
jgi:pyruvate kinase